MNDIPFDDLGPAKIIHLYDPQIPFKAVVVVDNTALGPAIGGVRVTPTVTVQEVARLARTMTLKSAVAGLPHGGGKSGIVVDPKDPRIELIFRTFARMIRDLREYIPAPDMGCDEHSMTWIQDEIGRVCGLPENLGGLPLDKLGATGFGLTECAEVACAQIGMEINGARVAIQGFGSVGKAAARTLTEKGARIVAVSDSRGTLFDAEGLDIDQVSKVKRGQGSVIDGAGQALEREAVFAVDCDILIPAATPDVIHIGNQAQIKARLILEGANIPATLEAEQALAERGVLVVPDFIANAGGLIMAAVEYAGGTEAEAFAAISSKLKTNTAMILDTSQDKGVLPRVAAEQLARRRVQKAMGDPVAGGRTSARLSRFR